MASQIISLGIGSPASIPYFLLLGLSPNADVAPPFVSTINLSGISDGTVELTGSKQDTIALSGRKDTSISLRGSRV